MTSTKQPPENHLSFWTAGRIALTLVALALIAVLGISSCNSTDDKNVGGIPDSGPPASKNTGQPATSAPAALPSSVREAKLKTVNGDTISMSDYSGKVLLVNIWATWCGPCRVETPELVRLHKEYRDKGVEIIGLTNDRDPQETPENVADFVKSFQVDYHIGWATPEVLSMLYDLPPQRDAIPQSYVISRDGRVIQKFVGFSPAYTPPQIRQAIDQALKM